MLTRLSRLSLTSLLIGLGTWSDCVSAQGLKSECEGLAVIAPRDDNHGTIYMKDNPYGSGKLDRAGYLPVGSVVVLEKLSSKKQGVDCGFHYEDEISGYLDGRDFVSLAGIMANIKLEEVYGFVAPDTRVNNDSSALKLFKDEGLTVPLDSFGVDSKDRAIIFLMTETPTASKVLRVKYATIRTKGHDCHSADTSNGLHSSRRRKERRTFRHRKIPNSASSHL